MVGSEKLTRAMARLDAAKQQQAHHREAIRKLAAEHLDGCQHAIAAANTHVAARPNALTYRYLRTKLTEAARLRAIAGQSEAEDDAAAASSG